jgi:hypothetical protein
MQFKKIIFGCMLVSLFSAAHADPIFTDNFDADALGMNKIDFLSGWNVDGGAVDVIGIGGAWNLIAGAGHYIDLDGSKMQGGVFAKSINLLAGVTYQASFFLAGNHRKAGNDLVKVSFGDQKASYVVREDDGFTQATLMFTPDASGSYALRFHNLGNDNMGALLDDVSLSVVEQRLVALAADDATDIPSPSTGLLVLAGAAGLSWISRRKPFASKKAA